MNTRSEKYYTDMFEAARINFEYFFNKNNSYGCNELIDVYVGKLFDYLLFNLAYSNKETAHKYYLNIMGLLNNYAKGWKNNIYFYDKQVSKLTLILRNSLKNKLLFSIYNTMFIKKTLKRKMENYQ